MKLRYQESKTDCATVDNRLSASIKRLDELRQRDARMEASVSSSFERFRQELLAGLNQYVAAQKSPRPLSKILGDMVEESKKARAAQDILFSLRFEGMDSRKHTIAGTHGDSYEWIFSHPRVLRQRGVEANFSGWLESGHGIFWVTGHPGSGKSTLMKFVDNHPTTIAKLETWGKGYRLVKASHFFWVNGSPLQKSQAGLLRSLCFDILRQCPEILPQLCEQRWADRGTLTGTEDWSLTELQQMLVRLQTTELKVKNERVRFCFLIDGLDEYSGDYDELLEDLRQLATSPHIKITAASRPWNMFEDAFGQDPTMMLTMEDLTSDDIAAYARDTLESDERFMILTKGDDEAEGLINEVIERANGVFLWVHLVVIQLRKLLADGDGLEDIQSKLGKFPSDLDDYFRHMLDTMDVFYQQKTAQIFRVCIRTRAPLALIAFAVLDDEDPLASKVKTGQDLTKDEVDVLHKRLEQHVQIHGPDLLEVVSEGSTYPHVQFTHRTVRDFLTHNNMDTLFAERAGADFRPLETLCQMSILTIKYISLLAHPSHEREFYLALIDDVLDYAHDMEIAESKGAFVELNLLEELLEKNRDITSSLDTNHDGPIMPLAIRHDLRLFIKQRAEHGPGTLQPVCHYPDRPLLSYALPTFQLKDVTPPKFRPEMVRILLNNGSDPNATSWFRDEEAKVERRAPVWSLYLRTVHSFYKRPKMKPTGALPIVVSEAIIAAGAHYVPNCLTEDGNKGEREILTFSFGKDEADRLLSLRSQPVKTARTGSGTAQRPSWAKAKSGLRRLSIGSNTG